MNSNLSKAETSIDFLSIELTNQCNLRCTHCYADAGPNNAVNDLLERAEFENIIRDGFELGSRKIQFIGGEPTLSKSLPYFVSYAYEMGYEYIEVFSNLTELTPELVDCFEMFKVKIATSVYAASETVHDKITKQTGSFSKTIYNIATLLDKGIEVRVGIIEMEENSKFIDETRSMLEGLGVQNIGEDKLRRVGRGEDFKVEELTELCGGCNGKTLSVSSDGVVSPCIMSKKMTIGSVRDSRLLQLSESEELSRLKGDLFEMEGIYAICAPKTCNPYGTCAPKHGPGPCEPSGCNPCAPKG